MFMKKEYNFYVYIMASNSGTLYVGFTNNIKRRVYEHRENLIDGFSKKYSCHKLVFYEHFTYVYNALNREKEIKDWNRKKKEELIKSINPHWNDLYDDLF
jgi:putative endonuclease